MAKRKKKRFGSGDQPFLHRDTARLDASAMRNTAKKIRRALEYDDCKVALRELTQMNRFLGEFRHAKVWATGKWRGSGATRAVKTLEENFYKVCVRKHRP